MRVAIVGGGLAGALLAWRLSERPGRPRVELFAGTEPMRADATAASGGLMRAFEPDPEHCAAAAESLAELLATAELRAWADFREIGSLYVLAPGADPRASAAIVQDALPGSASVARASELDLPFAGLPEDAVCVVEERAGHISPDRLRGCVLGLLSERGLVIRGEAVRAVTADGSVELDDATVMPYDAVVVAAGAWTGELLRRSGLPAAGLRTKQIQYTLSAGAPTGARAFVDETTGLYGRPDGSAGFLLGLPCDRWDVAPGSAEPDPELAARVRELAAARLGAAVRSSPADRVVAAVDCFSEQPGLRLRPVVACSQVFTFTGGSGASAKTALAASRVAAAGLLA